MFKRFFAAFAAALTKAFNAAMSTIDWLEQLAKWPFRFVFGHGAPAPSFTSDVSSAELVEDLKAARQATAVPRIDREGIDAVLEYCRAHPSERITMKLPSHLERSVRAALLTMDDAALRKLATSGIAKLRRFMSGETLDSEWVTLAANDTAPEGMTAHEHMVWRIREQMLKKQNSQPFTLARR